MTSRLTKRKARLTAEKKRLIERVKLLRGGHSSVAQGGRGIEDMKLCAMEFVNYMQHGLGESGRPSTNAPCVSPTIRDLMVHRNDSTNAQGRVRLLEVVPDILHTAPTMTLPYRLTTASSSKYLIRDEKDPEYQRLEVRRRQKARSLYVTALSMDEFIALVRELADMGRFKATPRKGTRPRLRRAA